MKQRPCQFGPEHNLIGILTEPDAKDLRPDAPAMLMLNAGLLHRVGPQRMAVDLAQRLAGCGVRSLRFDMGGYGDSEVAAGAQSDESRTFTDIKSAMDFLEIECDIHSFVLFGSCSGADNSFSVALRDPRVAGAVLLDGHGYWTWRSYANYYLARILRPKTWVNFIQRKLSPVDLIAEGRGEHESQMRRPFGDKLEVRHEIQTLVDRGTELLYCYTGGVSQYYNYAGQFYDMFRGLAPRGKIKVEYYPNADHTYTFAEDRERMFAAVVEWYRSRPWKNR